VREHWESDGPASAPERGGRARAAVLLSPRSGAGKRRPPATHGSAPWATILRPSGSARCLVCGLPLCGAGWHPARRLATGACWPVYRGSAGLTSRRTQSVPLPTCRTTSAEFQFVGKLSGIGQDCLPHAQGQLTHPCRRRRDLPLPNRPHQFPFLPSGGAEISGDQPEIADLPVSQVLRDRRQAQRGH